MQAFTVYRSLEKRKRLLLQYRENKGMEGGTFPFGNSSFFPAFMFFPLFFLFPEEKHLLPAPLCARILPFGRILIEIYRNKGAKSWPEYVNAAEGALRQGTP